MSFADGTCGHESKANSEGAGPADRPFSLRSANHFVPGFGTDPNIAGRQKSSQMKVKETIRSRWYVLVPVILVTGLAFAATSRIEKESNSIVPPERVDEDQQSESDSPEKSSSVFQQSNIQEVLRLAKASLEHMKVALPDYQARFVQQDRDLSGNLREVHEMQLKVQTRFRNETNDAPMRVYLKFNLPEANAGREVLWARDLNNGQMAVHETTMLLNLKTLWLDPDGMIAMAGQKYPIYEIGMIRLVEKLIERGTQDLDNPDINVVIKQDHEFDSIHCKLIRVTHGSPSGDPDDFSLAEIIFDPQRKLILSYRSLGWAEGEEEPPLLESYKYLDLQTDIGLTDADFDYKNPNYNFP